MTEPLSIEETERERPQGLLRQHRDTLDAIHRALGESEYSEDATLPEVIRQVVEAANEAESRIESLVGEREELRDGLRVLTTSIIRHEHQCCIGLLEPVLSSRETTDSGKVPE